MHLGLVVSQCRTRMHDRAPKCPITIILKDVGGCAAVGPSGLASSHSKTLDRQRGSCGWPSTLMLGLPNSTSIHHPRGWPDLGLVRFGLQGQVALGCPTFKCKGVQTLFYGPMLCQGLLPCATFCAPGRVPPVIRRAIHMHH